MKNRVNASYMVMWDKEHQCYCWKNKELYKKSFSSQRYTRDIVFDCNAARDCVARAANTGLTSLIDG